MDHFNIVYVDEARDDFIRKENLSAIEKFMVDIDSDCSFYQNFIIRLDKKKLSANNLLA